MKKKCQACHHLIDEDKLRRITECELDDGQKYLQCIDFDVCLSNRKKNYLNNLKGWKWAKEWLKQRIV